VKNFDILTIMKKILNSHVTNEDSNCACEELIRNKRHNLKDLEVMLLGLFLYLSLFVRTSLFVKTKVYQPSNDSNAMKVDLMHGSQTQIDWRARF
jgi:hypothetical protein